MSLLSCKDGNSLLEQPDAQVKLMFPVICSISLTQASSCAARASTVFPFHSVPELVLLPFHFVTSPSPFCFCWKIWSRFISAMFLQPLATNNIVIRSIVCVIVQISECTMVRYYLTIFMVNIKIYTNRVNNVVPPLTSESGRSVREGRASTLPNSIITISYCNINRKHTYIAKCHC